MPTLFSPFPGSFYGVQDYFFLAAVLVHAWTAYSLISENKIARPKANEVEITKRAGWSSLKMGLTGTIILAFVVFHLLHFTIRTIYPEYAEMKTLLVPLMKVKYTMHF